MIIDWIKAIHIVFIVSWFAALFYIVRLFIYAAEAQAEAPQARETLTRQLLIMQSRLWYIIGWPAMTGTLITGWWIILLNPSYYLNQPWMLLKLVAVAALLCYHIACEQIHRQQKKGIFRHSSVKLRLFNELATVLLVAIVFLVVIKRTEGLLYGVGGLLAFAALLMLAVMLYKRSRK